MKILLLFSQVNGNGGIPRFNRNLMQALRSEETITLSLNDKSGNGIIGFSTNKISFIYGAFKLIRDEKPDVVIIGLLSFIPMTVFKLISSTTFITILHGIEAWLDRGWLKWFYDWNDSFWAVSHYTKRIFSETNGVNPEKIKRIFNTIPDSWGRVNGQIHSEKYFLTVTRLTASEGYKGIDKTIEAVANIQDLMRDKGWTFKVVSSGDDLDRHIDIAKRHKIEDLVSFISDVSDDALQTLYSKAGFFILPSTGEGFGIVFLEAMAFSKACIGAKDCGTEDVIDDGSSGLLLNVSIDTIQRSIQLLMTDDELKLCMGNAGKNKLLNEYTFEKFNDHVLNLLSCVD